MKKLILVCTFLLGVFVTSETQAQASLGFDSSQCVFPAAVYQDSLVLTTVSLISTNSVPFTGDVKLIFGVEDSVVQPFDSVSFQQIALSPGTSANLSHVIQYSSFRFPLGIDVVVIWPKATGAATSDSIKYNVLVVSYNAIVELLEEDGFAVFPNPCSNRLIVENKRTKNPIEKVSVLSINGKLLLTKHREEIIDFTQLQDAFYLVEVYYKSGTRKVFKVQKNSTTESK